MHPCQPVPALCAPGAPLFCSSKRQLTGLGGRGEELEKVYMGTVFTTKLGYLEAVSLLLCLLME